MLKYLCSFLLLLASMNSAFAQRVKLKKPLTDKDQKEIEKIVTECFGFESQLRISFAEKDLFSDKNVVPDKPASLENIDSLKKTIKGDISDASVFSAISGQYGRLGMLSEEDETRQKAIEMLNAYIEQNPDSVVPVYQLAG